jgi:hypothetical protein
MAVANAMTSIGADKVRNKASLLTVDRFLMTEMIAHIRLIHHSIVAIMNTVHPVYGVGNNSASGKLYVQNEKMPPTGMLIAVRIIDITGNSCGLDASRTGS